MTARVVLLVTSPRLPAGLLTAQAWDLVRANPVLAERPTPQTQALHAAGVEVQIVAPTADAVLEKAQPTVVWLASPSGDEGLAREIGMRLAREPALAELELMYGSWDPPGAKLLDAVAVIDRLRAEDPWKREQTHRTLARYLLEEAFEAHDTILAEDYAALRGEMGDVLLQVLLHARMAEELPDDESWTIDDVAGDFVDKMMRRNPHVFGGLEVSDTAEIIENWERIKQAEKPQLSFVDSVTWSLPALLLANKVLEKARRVGAAEPEGEGALGDRLLKLVAEAPPDTDAEAELRLALRRYAEGIDAS
ncbi:nucleoside triphosphate pyrophosphohydrolase [Rhizocola hellebori]|uniref:Nucleoside triphosphate pyrophosphohydrolase n=1 Tax=Rhizocola hellebori TaxID=1392758 RepID=A0A8J3QIP0_9ACTN|nr:MazG family protein [Rhizocola hellebori]GIH09936.1 nucleoside triphosphate pyrophosphohydrolase [Rhizocola hellebori]